MKKMIGEKEIKIENLKNLEEIQHIIKIEREEGKKVVFTNGCYDILHIGHIHTLQKCAELKGNGIFIIGLNSDESARKFKGEERPKIKEKDRAYIIGNIKGVDYVVLFNEDNPLELLRAIKPDICVKGGAPILERVKQEWEIVQSYGGMMVLLPLIEGYSTTKIIEEMKG